MKPRATIGADCGKSNGGFGRCRPDGRGGFEVATWEWRGPDERKQALGELRREIRWLAGCGYDVTVYVERAFVPRKPGAYHGGGLVQSEAVGRIRQVCDEEGVPVVDVATQTWRSKWGMKPTARDTDLHRAARAWARLLLGRTGRGDHMADGLLISMHDTPEAILWAARIRGAANGTKAARLLDDAMLRVAAVAVNLQRRPLRSPGRAPGAVSGSQKRRPVTMTEDEVRRYLERIGR